MRPAVTVSGASLLEVGHLNTATETIAGEVLGVRTTLSEVPADCELQFLVEGTLSKIACEARVPKDEGAQAVADRIAIALSMRYGAADRHEEGEVFGWEGRWGWSDEAAQVELYAKEVAIANIVSSTLTLGAETTRHRLVIEEATERAQRAAQADRAQSESERARRREEIRERLRQRRESRAGERGAEEDL